MKSIQTIQELVAREYQISIEEMLGSKRPNYIVWPRQVAMYLCYKLCDLGYGSQMRIAIEFKKDHGTVRHAINTISDRVRLYPSAARELNQLEVVIHKELMRDQTIATPSSENPEEDALSVATTSQ